MIKTLNPKNPTTLLSDVFHQKSFCHDEAVNSQVEYSEDTHYEECLLSFGQHQECSGILCQSRLLSTSDICFVFLNAGLVPRSGPFRLHTYLARALAAKGIPSFRFDFRGIGDSDYAESKAQAALPLASTVLRPEQEVCRAISKLKEVFPNCRPIVFGICTGADNAQKALYLDERICGAVVIDGYAYPTLRYYWQHLTVVVRDIKRLFGVCQRLIVSLVRTPLLLLQSIVTDTAASRPSNILFDWTLPEKSEALKQYSSFIKRRQRLLVIFTGGVPEYRYSGQLADAFSNLSFGEDIQEHFVQKWDHLFSLEQDQRDLFELICRWLEGSAVGT